MEREGLKRNGLVYRGVGIVAVLIAVIVIFSYRNINTVHEAYVDLREYSIANITKMVELKSVIKRMFMGAPIFMVAETEVEIDEFYSGIRRLFMVTRDLASVIGARVEQEALSYEDAIREMTIKTKKLFMELTEMHNEIEAYKNRGASILQQVKDALPPTEQKGYAPFEEKEKAVLELIMKSISDWSSVENGADRLMVRRHLEAQSKELRSEIDALEKTIEATSRKQFHDHASMLITLAERTEEILVDMTYLLDSVRAYETHLLELIDQYTAIEQDHIASKAERIASLVLTTKYTLCGAGAMAGGLLVGFALMYHAHIKRVRITKQPM